MNPETLKLFADTHEAIKLLRYVVHDRPVAVVGSAPLKEKLARREGEIVLAVNGGIGSTVGPVDIWQVNSRSSQFEQWGPGRKRLATLMLKQGAKRDVGLLLFIAREQEAPPTTRKILGGQKTTWRYEATILQASERRQLEEATGARTEAMKKDAMSAGLTAACYALYAGAAAVRLVGFSWLPGYEYLPGERIDARGHVRADQRALVNLLARYAGRVEHDLVIPPAMMETPRMPPTKPTTKPATLTEATAQGQAPVEGETPVPQRVQAMKMIFYNNRRIRPGEVFTLRKPTDFKPKQMQRVTAEQPPTPPAAFRPRHPLPDIARRELQRGSGTPRTSSANDAAQGGDVDVAPATDDKVLE